MIYNIFSYKRVRILVLGIVIMVVSNKDSFSHNDSSTFAQKVLADFLQQPIDTVYCTLLTDGFREAAIVKCTHNIKDYIIKIFTDKSGKNEIAWTKQASDLGIGPRFYYADPSASYMIIEYVNGSSLTPEIANKPQIIESISRSLSLLHNSCVTFAHASHIFTRIYSKYNKLSCSGQLKNILENSSNHVQQIEKKLKDIIVPLVPCHNDLNPGNIFVDNNQVTLIDWGDAALANPYYDIAVFLVLNVVESENEKLFFQHYDTKLLSSEWQNYMYLCKELIYFEFALNLLLGVQANTSELLNIQNISQFNNLSYYLTHLAKQDVEINSTFLYNMAIASLSKINLPILG